MREVDEALARAYAERSTGRSSSRACLRHPTCRLICSSPHKKSDQNRPSVELQWPALVVALERDWGTPLRANGPASPQYAPGSRD